MSELTVFRESVTSGCVVVLVDAGYRKSPQVFREGMRVLNEVNALKMSPPILILPIRHCTWHICQNKLSTMTSSQRACDVIAAAPINDSFDKKVMLLVIF